MYRQGKLENITFTFAEFKEKTRAPLETTYKSSNLGIMVGIKF
jgi:hypothetical protein